MVRVIACVVTLSAVLTSAGGQQAVLLTPGVPIERPIAAGDRLSYTLPVNAGDAIKIAADQIGANVAIEATLDGSPAGTADDKEKQRYGRELLLWQAPAAGTLTIVVRAQSVLPAGGRMRLQVSIYPADDRLPSAIAAFNQARQFPHATGAAAARNAEVWQSALAAWRAVGDAELVAMCLDGLGVTQLRDLGAPADSIPTYVEAAHMFESLGLKTETYFALQTLGSAELQFGDTDRALVAFEHAYDWCDEIDPINRGLAEHSLARVEEERGDLDRAATFGERAVATLHAADAHHEEMIALDQLALIDVRLRRIDEALALITRAVALGRQNEVENDLANVMLVVGRVQAAAYDYDAALEAYREATRLFKPPSPNLLIAALGEARIQNRRGEPQLAKEILESTLDATPRQMRNLWSAVADELGVTYTGLGDGARALPLQQQALEIVMAGQTRSGQLTVLRDIASTYRALGDLAASNTMIDRAMAINAEMPSSADQAIFLRERAHTAAAGGDNRAAAADLDRALQIVESERGRLQSDTLRSLYGATLSDYYGDAVDVEMHLHESAPSEGHDTRAFELFERSRARSLSDLIAERGIDIKSGVDPALVAEQRGLQRQLGAKDAAIRDLGATPRGRARVPDLERDISDVERRLAVVDAKIRTASPRYAALQRPEPAALDTAQRLLDDRTVLVAVSLGTGASWGWAVTRESMRAFALPPAATIEEHARRVYTDLTARQIPPSRRGSRSIADIDRDLTDHAAALSDTVLGPIAEPLENEWRTHRLAVVTTGALQYVPFAALPAPHRSGASPPARTWLIDRHEIVQLPSMSVLAELRRDTIPRPRTGVRLAVLADPVYAADDPRVARAAANRPPDVADAAGGTRPSVDLLTRGLSGDSVRAGFERLVFSREEAKAIAALMPSQGVLEALDFDASVRTMNGPKVASASIVHIASHGILNSARPELSGLALSMLDRSGRPTDGLLHLYDVLNLKLAADFVVLSGCQTGLGRAMEGEGLIGLSRAFMYAGVQRVIASLWEVDDLATADLMRRFYRGVLVERLRPAAALAAAQRDMRRDPRWRSPYYWAAFTVVGDWR